MDAERVLVKELKARSATELRHLRDTKHEELYRAQIRQTLGKQRETHVFKELRRDIARINTELGSRKKEQD